MTYRVSHCVPGSCLSAHSLRWYDHCGTQSNIMFDARRASKSAHMVLHTDPRRRRERKFAESHTTYINHVFEYSRRRARVFGLVVHLFGLVRVANFYLFIVFSMRQEIHIHVCGAFAAIVWFCKMATQATRCHVHICSYVCMIVCACNWYKTGTTVPFVCLLFSVFVRLRLQISSRNRCTLGAGSMMLQF